MPRFPDLLARIAATQTRRPLPFLLVAVLCLAAALPLVARLGLNSDFVALLPTYKPSVQDFERVGRRVGGMQTLTVVIESDDLPAMQRFARDLVPRLERLGAPLVRNVDWNVRAYADFVTAHQHLFASTADLTEVRDALSERLDYERGRANPFFVQLDDFEPPDPAEVVRRIQRRAEDGQRRLERFPGGFYVHPDGRALVVFVRSSVGGSSKGLRRLLRAVEGEVSAMQPTRYASDLRIGYAGNVVSSLREHDAIETELELATSLSVVLTLAVLWFFFRKPRAMALIGFGLAIPVFVTFAFAKLAVGELNTSTAFLGSIVVGNGVNPFIVWLARYFEERKRGLPPGEAVIVTHRSVGPATLAASLASAVAYGSLVVTDFRGFRDFGVIGIVGMVLCWLGTISFFPALVMLSEKVLPLRFAPSKEASNAFGGPFARLVTRAPRRIIAVSAVLTMIGVVAIGFAIARDPLEYDFRNLRSVSTEGASSHRVSGMGDEVKSAARQSDGIAMVLERAEDVPPLAAELERRRDEANAPWGRVRVVQDLLPNDQETKIELLAEIRALLLQFRSYANESVQADIDAHLPPEDVSPLTLADLPEPVARPYAERDGTRGRLLLVERAEGESIWDGRYLMRWAGALREMRLPDGSRPPLAGRAPMFADMIESILVDGPRAVAASLGATLLIVFFAFRRARQRLLTMGSLLVGVIWMAGAMALLGMKLNFLNFVAFPITFGIGVEYAVNVMRRYLLEQDAGSPSPVRAAIAESGGAVVLCSATTVIGYATLLVSSNLALRSFGLSMAISEITCLAAAVLSMPALLVLLDRRRGAPEAESSSEAA